MTLRELLDAKFKPYHFTSSMKDKIEKLTVVEDRRYEGDKLIDNTIHQSTRKPGHYWVECVGVKGGHTTVSIEYAKSRHSYRVH